MVALCHFLTIGKQIFFLNEKTINIAPLIAVPARSMIIKIPPGYITNEDKIPRVTTRL
jgi:hypothetical protein